MNKTEKLATISDLIKKKEELEEKEKNLNPNGEFSFEEIMRQNKEKADKLKQMRKGVNKKVKRDYNM